MLWGWHYAQLDMQHRIVATHYSGIEKQQTAAICQHLLTDQHFPRDLTANNKSNMVTLYWPPDV